MTLLDFTKVDNYTIQKDRAYRFRATRFPNKIVLMTSPFRKRAKSLSPRRRIPQNMNQQLRFTWNSERGSKLHLHLGGFTW